MKNSYKAALLVALGLVSASAVQAQYATDELYLGFTQASATSDIVIDLGQASSIVGQTSVVDLSSLLSSSELSAFSSVFASANGVNMSVIGGNNTFGQGNAYATQLRSAAAIAAGNNAAAGSSVTKNLSSATLTGAAGVIAGDLSLPTGNAFVQDTTKAFSGLVATGVQNNYVGKLGVTPTVAIGNATDGSGIAIEDLWLVQATSPKDVYEGYFTFNNNSDSLTFTGADVTAVPEHTTYGMLAGAGLLVLSLRNQFTRKQA